MRYRRHVFALCLTLTVLSLGRSTVARELTYRAADASGNASRSFAVVTVPFGQGR